MGRVTLYSELLISDYCNAEILRERVLCCIDTKHPPLIHKLDWFLWAYILFELSIKKLAVFYKIKKNAKLHNCYPIFFSFFRRGNFGNGLELYLKSKIKEKGYLDYDYFISELCTMFAIDFVSLRYDTKHLDTVNTFDFQVLRDFLDCVSTLVLELETGKISIELEVP